MSYKLAEIVITPDDIYEHPRFEDYDVDLLTKVVDIATARTSVGWNDFEKALYGNEYFLDCIEYVVNEFIEEYVKAKLKEILGEEE